MGLAEFYPCGESLEVGGAALARGGGSGSTVDEPPQSVRFGAAVVGKFAQLGTPLSQYEYP